MIPKYEKHVFICINERDPNSPKGDCARCEDQKYVWNL